MIDDTFRKSQLPRNVNGYGGQPGFHIGYSRYNPDYWYGEGNQRAYFPYGLGCEHGDNCFECPCKDDCHYKARRPAR